MPDARSPSDLSMDEILSTIRRIIADDEEPGGRAADGSAAATGGVGADDDVLELTAALNDDGTVRHLAPIGGSSRREPAAVVTRGTPDADTVRLEPAARPATAAAATPREAGVTGPPGDRTLEDIVTELLRPMMQKWLEENLPRIVERVIEAEIARTARAAVE